MKTISCLKGSIALRQFFASFNGKFNPAIRAFAGLLLILCAGQSFAALNFSASNIATGVSGTGEIIAVDFDGVNGQDLVVFGQAADIEIFLNNGLADFDSPILVSVGGNTLSKGCVVDVDGVNGLDIVATDTASNNLVVFLNDGVLPPALTFTPNTFVSGVSPFNIACADLNGDTDPDVVTRGNPDISVLLNNGAGGFNAAIPQFVAHDFLGSDVVLLDAFSSTDLAIIAGDDNLSGALAVFENDGFASYAPHVDYDLGNFNLFPPADIKVADIGGSAAEDIIFISPNAMTVSTVISNGDGTFQAPVSYPVGQNPSALVMAEIDGLNGVDIVVVDDVDDTISVLLNNGDGTFANPLIYTTGAGTNPNGVVALDIDNDFKVDLVTFNADNTLEVLINTNGPDTRPKPFGFPNIFNADPNTMYVSAPGYVTGLGIYDSAPVSVSNGEFRISPNSIGTYTTSPSYIRNFRSIYLRRMSPGYNQTEVVSLNIGGEIGTFTITTKNDIDPDPFSFIGAANVDLSTDVDSAAVQITGLLAPAPVQISAGQYCISLAPGPCGIFTSASGSISNGEYITVRVKSSDIYNWTKTAGLTIEKFTANFRVTTKRDTQAGDIDNKFTDYADAPLSTLVESNNVMIYGIGTAIPISISDDNGNAAQYSINSGAWTNAAGLVSNGSRVKVRVLSSGTISTAINVTLTVGNPGELVSDVFTVTTVADIAPDVFAGAFVNDVGVARSATMTSNTIVATGMTPGARVPVSALGGTYSLDGTAFTNLSGFATADGSGEVSLTLRVAASSLFNTTRTATITLGDQSASYSVTTELDNIPVPISFLAANDVEPGAVVTSIQKTVFGIQMPVDLSIAGGSYSINGGAWDNAPLVAGVNPNDKIRLQGTAAAYGLSQDVVLTLAGVDSTFRINTINDVYPDAFDLGSINNVARSSSQQSNTVVISGIDASTPISVKGGSYSIGVVPGVWTSAPGVINDGESVTVRGTSSSSFDRESKVVLSVGRGEASFSITTEKDDLAGAFSFVDKVDVPLSTMIESNNTVVYGIGTAIPISISDDNGNTAQYSINSGAWTNAAGMVSNASRVKVRVLSSGTISTAINVTLTVGNPGEEVNGVFTVTTVADIAPDVFAGAFVNDVGVARSATMTSNTIVATGMTPGARVPVSALGGTYSLDGTAFTNLSGFATADGSGEVSLTLRVAASSLFNTTRTATITLGDQSASYSVTTELDNIPVPISFLAANDVEPGAVVTSIQKTVFGIQMPVDLSIAGGSYSINGGAWDNAPLVAGVNPNDKIRLQGTAAAYGLSQDVVLTLAGVDSTFRINTINDVYPDAFDLGSINNVARSSLQTSNTVVISGIDASTPISVKGGSYSIGVVPGVWTSAPGVINDGESVTVRGTSSSSFDRESKVVLSVGRGEGSFSISTEKDSVAGAFSFMDKVDVPLSTMIESNNTVVYGIGTAIPISISDDNGNTAQYSINSGAWTNAAGMVSNASRVKVRVLSSGTISTAINVTLTVGNPGEEVNGVFTVTTVADIAPDVFAGAFVNDVGVARSATMTSNTIVATGMTPGARVPVSALGGTYSLDGTAFTNLSGFATADGSGEVSLTLRVAASSLFNTTRTATVTLGDQSASYSVTTELDNIPVPIIFIAANDVEPSAVVTSFEKAVLGIQTPVNISIVGGFYSINGGAWDNANTTVNPNDKIRLQGTAAAYGLSQDVVLTLAGVDSTFRINTINDVYPDAFDLGSINNVARSSLQTSNTVAVSGIDLITPTPISVKGGSYQIGAGPWTSAPGVINDGESVTVRGTSSSSFDRESKVVLSVGRGEGSFSITTEKDDLAGAFSFVDKVDVPLSTMTESNSTVVYGIGTAIPIAITNDPSGTAQYSINSGAWTNAAGVISNGERIKVRVMSNAAVSTPVTMTLSVGNPGELVSSTFTVTTVADIFPDVFAFTNDTGVALGATVTSNTVTATGMAPGAQVPVSALGGTYSLDGGTTFTNLSGFATADGSGEVSLTLRVAASSLFNTTRTVTITLGDQSASYSVTTELDNIPVPIIFIAANDVEPSAVVTSFEKAVLGIQTPVNISIVGGFYSINGGAWDNANTTVNPNDKIRLQGTAAAYGLSQDVVLTLAGVDSTFRINTINDVYPDAFDLGSINNVARSSLQTSNTVAVSGIDLIAPTPISVKGGSYQIGADPWTSAPGVINNGDSVTVRGTSSSSFDRESKVVLSVGRGEASFSITTEKDDLAGAFSFVDKVDVPLSTMTESNSTVVYGIGTAIPIAITNDPSGTAQYSINSGAWTNAAGVISNGERIKVRVMSNAAVSTPVTMTLSVGNPGELVSSIFTVTTVADIFPDVFAFTNDTGVALGATVTSNTVTATGMAPGAQVPVSALGGTYSLDGGTAFTNLSGFATADGSGEVSLTLRVAASSLFNTTRTATVTLGDQSASYSVTTELDNIPVPIIFIAANDVEPSAVVTSFEKAVLGIQTPVNISIVGGFYSINGGAWDNANTTVNPNDKIRLQGTAAAYGLSQDVVLTLAGVDSTFRINTINDVYPDAFDLGSINNVARSSLQTSNTVAVSGIDLITPTPISVKGGSYHIGADPWTSAPGVINNGDSVTVRGTSSSSFDRESKVVLSVGRGEASFSITTEKDDLAGAFSFVDKVDVPLSTMTESNSTVVYGIGIAIPIQISDDNGNTAQYSINSGAWTNAAGTLTNGSRIKVRVLSKATVNSAVNVTLTVGNPGEEVSDVFTVTTVADIFPDVFAGAFINDVGVTRGATATSNTITVTGMDIAARVPVSAKGGLYSLDGGATFTNLSGFVTANGSGEVSLTLRVDASSMFKTTRTATVTLGDQSANYSVTSELDNIPLAITFPEVHDVNLSTRITSISKSVLGIQTAIDISIVGGEYSINGGAWTNVAAVGGINPGDTVRVRTISSPSYATSVDGQLTVGNIVNNFRITTTPDIFPEPFSFADARDIVRGEFVESEEVIITGILAPTRISIDGAGLGNRYSINNGPFTAERGFVVEGDHLKVGTTASNFPVSSKQVAVTVGDQTGVFLVVSKGYENPFKTHTWTDEEAKKKGGGGSSGLFGAWIYLNMFTFMLVIARFYPRKKK